MDSVTVAGQHLEIAWIAPTRDAAPPLVLLHEGLGSVAMWRDFPERLARATGCGVLAYSRAGYGKSAPLGGPRQISYMHDEATEVLPALLAALDLAAPILIGHSDGASIAIIHAGEARWPVRGLILEAPHVFVEDVTVASIAEAKIAYQSTDLRARLARYHADVDSAFRGWNDIWLDPSFRAWTIEASVPRITCPMLLIQGRDDRYGTLAQLDGIERRAAAPVERLVLADCGHSPHREQPEATIAAMAAFVARIGDDCI